jgi:hypothetical protein
MEAANKLYTHKHNELIRGTKIESLVFSLCSSHIAALDGYKNRQNGRTKNNSFK